MRIVFSGLIFSLVSVVKRSSAMDKTVLKYLDIFFEEGLPLVFDSSNKKKESGKVQT